MTHNRNSDITSLKDAINGFVKESHLEDKFNEHKLMETWKEVMGNAILSRTKRLYLNHGTLFVSVDSAPLRNKLHFEKEKLMTLLNSKFDQPLVENVVIK